MDWWIYCLAAKKTIDEIPSHEVSTGSGSDRVDSDLESCPR
jgi:hypothetical protein